MRYRAQLTDEREWNVIAVVYAVGFQQFGDEDLQLAHEVIHGGRFRDQAGNVIAFSDPNGRLLIPKSVYLQDFTASHGHFSPVVRG